MGRSELGRLDTLVSAHFDAVEFRMQNHGPTCTSDWLVHLNRPIIAVDVPVLHGSGSVDHEWAVAHAEDEYVRYRVQLAATPTKAEGVYLESIEHAQCEIEDKK